RREQTPLPRRHCSGQQPPGGAARRQPGHARRRRDRRRGCPGPAQPPGAGQRQQRPLPGPRPGPDRPHRPRRCGHPGPAPGGPGAPDTEPAAPLPGPGPASTGAGHRHQPAVGGPTGYRQVTGALSRTLGGYPCFLAVKYPVFSSPGHPSMIERDKHLSTEQKALTINLDEQKYGTIVEIGAGQEVARQFFNAGAAAGTIAKTASAYDMQISDEIYGKAGRYVSLERLRQMLDHEYDLLIERLANRRSRNTPFFSYAATVTAKGYKQNNECHGWIGIRLQMYPGAPASEIVMHVNMMDETSRLQSEALGI